MSIVLKLVSFICVLLVILLVICRQIGYLVLYLGFRRRIEPTESQVDYSFIGTNNLNLEEGFIGKDDNLRKTYLFKKDMNKSNSVVVFAMGYGYFIPDYSQTIISLVESGYDVFTFDARAHGESGGKSPLGYPQFVIDLKGGIEAIKSEYANIMLLGHSIGGFASLSYLKERDFKVKAVVAAAPVNKGDVFAISVYEKFPCIFTKQMIIGAQNYDKKHFGKLADLSAVEGINSVDIPVLILQGNQDELVTIDTCSMFRYKNKITNEKAIIKIIDGGKHDLHKEDDVNSMIVEFFKSNT